MKRLISLFALIAVWAYNVYGFEVNGLRYELRNNGTVTVYGTGNSGAVVIPKSVKYSGFTYDVTSIGNSAFNGCSGLTSVTIPNSVTSIGNSAFSGCSGLTGTLTIPNSVTEIGEKVFNNCSGLTSVTIPNSVTSIGNSAFEGCRRLTSVEIPNSVTSIGSFAFYNCRGLSSVTIGNSVTSIGDYAFGDCNGLTSVTIPNSVTEIGNSAFNGCSGLTSVTIPNSVTSIGNSAFNGCSGLTNLIWNAKNCSSNGNMTTGGIKSVIIGNEVEILPNNFVNGAKITEIIISNSVKTIGSNAFSGCSSLTNLIWRAKNCPSMGNMPTSGITSATIGNGVKILPDNFVNGSKITEITIPNSVTTIGNSAFSNCNGLTSVTIPNSVKTIGEGAFYNCSGLTKVEISDLAAWCGITFGNETANPLYCAQHLYLNSSEIKDLVIPSSVASIGDYAFYHCSGLTSVTIGNSVKTIGEGAFDGCSGLAKVEISDLAAWCGITFGNETANPLYCAQHLYLNSSEIKDLVIPSSVTSIDFVAFYNCNGLTSVTIGNFVTEVGDYAFYHCGGLKSVTIGNSVTSIGKEAFVGSGGLTNLIWNAKNCSSNGNMSTGSITSATIGNEVEILPANFLNSSKITEITIPNSVASIGDKAFYYCIGLTSVTNYASTPQTIDDYMFYGVDVPNCKLYVWHESLDAYKAANIWKYFDIQDMGGVEGVEVDAATKGVEGYYNLQGIRLNEPARGQVNIVRYTDGTAKKVVVK